MIVLTFLRSLAFEIGRWFFMAIVALIAQFLWPFSYKTRFAVLRYWGIANLWWLKVTCGLSYRVHGAEHINRQQPSLILSHHESAWETIALQSIFPRQSFVLKQELLKIPFFGWTLSMLKPIAIDRSAGHQALKQILDQGYERIHSDQDWVTIFPEGTRVKPGTVGKIGRGGAMLAKHVNVPVYLVDHNAGTFWPKNSLIRKPGVIDVWISPALDVSDMTVDEINLAIKNWFEKSH